MDERVKEIELHQLPRGRKSSREYQILQPTGKHAILLNVKATTQLHVIINF